MSVPAVKCREPRKSAVFPDDGSTLAHHSRQLLTFRLTSGSRFITMTMSFIRLCRERLWNRCLAKSFSIRVVGDALTLAACPEARERLGRRLVGVLVC
jgi:hypothetical protein